MSDPIIEAAARALRDESYMFFEMDEAGRLATAMLAAVTPMIEDAYVRSRATIHVAAIRNATLEEAEQAVRQCSCLDEHGNILATRSVIAAIRALRDKS
jgi:selenocysteine lyase/cysteine desulfurase